MEKIICVISKQNLPANKATKVENLRPQLKELILKDYPTIKPNDYIANDILEGFREKYIEKLIHQENRALSKLEKEVVKAIQSDTLLSTTYDTETEKNTTLGQRVADKIAAFGGSWTFISIFFIFLLGWMMINTVQLFSKNFDPYPFILLNLILSCLAAIQAPIIMMSQNRQEDKDRQRSEHDYKINLKAELEIRLLHEKLDHLIIHQNKQLLDIQELQIDYLKEIINKNTEN